VVGICERKGLLGRHRRRWEDNIKPGVKDIGRGVIVWIYLAEDTSKWRALGNKVMSLRGSITCVEFF
jgi:hypothetical protein